MSTTMTIPTETANSTVITRQIEQPELTQLTKEERDFLKSRIKKLHDISEPLTWSADTASRYKGGQGVPNGKAALAEGEQYYDLTLSDGSRFPVSLKGMRESLRSLQSGACIPPMFGIYNGGRASDVCRICQQPKPPSFPHSLCMSGWSQQPVNTPTNIFGLDLHVAGPDQFQHVNTTKGIFGCDIQATVSQHDWDQIGKPRDD